MSMLTQAIPAQRFVRRTQLAAHEYRKNFRQLDDEIIAALTSPAADKVTPSMSKIYLRLVSAPAQYHERAGVLRFTAEERGERTITAWVALCEVLGVASGTANKALTWLHEQGIIGYFAGKNGVGVRIFLNRAVASIGTRTEARGEKILPFTPASKLATRASSGEVAFKDSFAVLETLDSNLDPSALKSSAGTIEVSDSLQNFQAKNSLAEKISPDVAWQENTGRELSGNEIGPNAMRDLTQRLKQELEPVLTTVAARIARSEHERTREWLEKHGLPKAARVAQREAYNLLRQQGVIKGKATRPPTSGEDYAKHELPLAARSLEAAELAELASTCLAMREIHGQAFALTLAALSTDAGGCLTSEDAAKILALAEELCRAEQPL